MQDFPRDILCKVFLKGQCNLDRAITYVLPDLYDLYWTTLGPLRQPTNVVTLFTLL